MPRPGANYDDKVKNKVAGQFLIDCSKECGAEKVPGWDYNQAEKEFFRFSQWVRRMIEEVNWFELNGGGKNINAHLQLRLLSAYQDLMPLISPELVGRFKLPANEGQAPGLSWSVWYEKRAREAHLWYHHWCSHIQCVEGMTFGNMANTRLLKIRGIWQLYKNKRV